MSDPLAGAEPPQIDAEAFTAFEAAGWERKAATYDRLFGQLTGRLVEPLLDAAHIGAGDRVLDVATGPGYVAGKAVDRGAAVIGVDIAPAMVALAQRSVPRAEFRVGNAELLPFADDTFDAVVGNFMIMHVPRPERAGSEFVRILKPGGRLALTAWDAPDHNRFLGVILDAIAAAGALAPTDTPAGPPFFRLSDDAEFSRLLIEAGLVDVGVDAVAFHYAVPSAEHLWDGLLAGTVRTAGLVLGQPEETRRRIRTALDGTVAPYHRGDGLELPASVKLAHGTKPRVERPAEPGAQA
jgi:ubiquinone/menaquinone biosynthesis C-methylase UbiE